MIYLSDGHGDVRYLTDETGNITDYYRYTAYGELAQKVGTTQNPYLYCGEYYDEGTGLYYLRARYMNTTTGTFISMDTYQGNTYDPASLHKYTYAQNNPQMYNDPSGHFVSMISGLAAISSHSIMSNLRTLNVMGMVGGFMNVAVNQVFGTGENVAYTFLEGYAVGFGMGMAYYGVAAIAALYELSMFFHLGIFSIAYFEAAKNITLAIACHSVGADKEALVYSVFAVMCIVTMCSEIGISAEIAVAGRKGTTNISVESGRATTNTDFYVTRDGTVIPANKIKTNSLYDRLEVEVYSGKSVRPQNAIDDWNDFLGDNQTDINPFTGERSIDRIWSADGKRSIRFGEHEMAGMGTKRFHYHKETWYDDYVVNVVQRIQQR